MDVNREQPIRRITRIKGIDTKTCYGKSFYRTLEEQTPQERSMQYNYQQQSKKDNESNFLKEEEERKRTSKSRKSRKKD